MDTWRLQSNSQSKLEWLGTEGSMLEEHHYLFRTRKGEDTFIEIQKSLDELNDFCFVLFQSMANVSQQTAEEQNTLIETLWEEDDYLNWESVVRTSYSCADFGKIFSPASAVLLLFATFIRHLHAIASHYGESKYKQWLANKDPRAAEIPPLVELLESICNRKLDVFNNAQVKALITERARYLRNKFIHGDWQAVEKGLVGVTIRCCFEAVAHVFTELELVFDEDLTPSGKIKTLSFNDEGKWSFD